VFARAAARHSPAFARVTDLLSGWMNFRDDPAHARLREPVRAAFTPRAVAALEPAVREVVEQTLDGFSGDVVEMHEAFSRPIPAVVIALLLGAEPSDRASFQHWSDDLAAMVFSLDPRRVDEAPLVAATDRFVAYFSTLIERARETPSDDLLSAMVHSDAGSLGTLELVGACTLLLFGGHETTTNLLDNSLALLLERPDLADRLRADPSLWPTAIDELMRALGPARTMARKVVQPHQRGGHALAVGDTVFLSIAAANHDEAVFEKPAEIDLARSPNPHLGFGWGPHYCLGANLARLEARVALSALLERYPKLAPAEPISRRAGGVMGFAPRRIVARLG
jgi:cytochrome P450